MQIPGDHYNFVKKTHQFIDDDEAHLKLMLQCLTGDGTDNIPGIKGVGAKTAEKILKGIPMERRWNRVRASCGDIKRVTLIPRTIYFVC